MSFMQRLLLVCLQNNFLFRTRHVPGTKNDLADSVTFTDSEISTPCSTTHATHSDAYPDSPTTRTLADVVKHLLHSSLQPSSLPTYRRAWKLYSNFSIDVFGQGACPLPLPPSNLAIFIAYLYKHNYAPSTVNTYVSALGYIHRLAGVADPTKVFFILEVLKGYGKAGARLDIHAFQSQFPSWNGCVLTVHLF